MTHRISSPTHHRLDLLKNGLCRELLGKFLVVGGGFSPDGVKFALECERRSVAGAERIDALEARLVEVFKRAVVQQLGNVI